MFNFFKEFRIVNFGLKNTFIPFHRINLINRFVIMGHIHEPRGRRCFGTYKGPKHGSCMRALQLERNPKNWFIVLGFIPLNLACGMCLFVGFELVLANELGIKQCRKVDPFIMGESTARLLATFGVIFPFETNVFFGGRQTDHILPCRSLSSLCESIGRGLSGDIGLKRHVFIWSIWFFVFFKATFLFLFFLILRRNLVRFRCISLS